MLQWNRTIDITTPDGRMSAYIQAFLDDLYALDARRRSLDSVKYRKGKNITIGHPPFGTIRGEDGLLIPSPGGGWLMSDGTFKHAKDKTQPPHPDATWRGYYECAELMLTLYINNLHGYIWIAREMNQRGWALEPDFYPP